MTLATIDTPVACKASVDYISYRSHKGSIKSLGPIRATDQEVKDNRYVLHFQTHTLQLTVVALIWPSRLVDWALNNNDLSTSDRKFCIFRDTGSIQHQTKLHCVYFPIVPISPKWNNRLYIRPPSWERGTTKVRVQVTYPGEGIAWVCVPFFSFFFFFLGGRGGGLKRRRGVRVGRCVRDRMSTCEDTLHRWQLTCHSSPDVYTCSLVNGLKPHWSLCLSVSIFPPTTPPPLPLVL